MAMATNSTFQTSYSNERPPSQGSTEKDNDMTGDPASSSFFTNDYKKHEDLKQMLDSNKDNLKLEAMKRIIGMVAKGKDASDLFPAVVKNVVSKSIEVKKLVYVYLTRYAEEQQDLALLSISTFQRALKDPNQLIRGSALRVLSSIRVPMIVPIMMLAIKESVSDMSPYVRKTAAHAIPKLYNLDTEQKELLIEVIEKLLADKTTLVAGSAIQAFEEVCPERIDLIHKNYRKLCNLLVDVEEWGQVVIINMLTRYCRLQFVNPNKTDLQDENNRKEFYGSSDESEKADRKSRKPSAAPIMDPDHRLLLRTCRPLLNSRNAAVVMAVAQLYHHCAPKSEVSTVAKALIRLLRGHKEVQFVVLTNIASMSVKQKEYQSMFEPYLKSFFVRFNDPTHVKLLKLEILTNLGNDANISTILREFQTYVSSSDKELAAATIQSIGRCATTISEITDTCLNGLLNLLSNRNEAVVAESVIVIKKLLQMRPSEHKEIIIHMAKLADHITVPMAKASILWLIGEYSDRVPKIAPDVLRKMAKTFVDEEDIVKLQILNLASKLCITNPKQAKPLCQYVFNLAKYDVNYDIRDRTRFLRQLVLLKDEKSSGLLSKHVKKIFLAPKPVPLLESKFKEMDHFQLGTLSHMIGVQASGYQELPDWPEVAPDPSARNIEPSIPWSEKRLVKKEEKKKPFFSDEESTSSGSSSGSSSSDDDGDGDSSSDDSSAKSDKNSDSEDDKASKKYESSSGEEEEEEEEESDDDENDDDGDDSKLKSLKEKEITKASSESYVESRKKESLKPEKKADVRNKDDSDDDNDDDDEEEENSSHEEPSSDEDVVSKKPKSISKTVKKASTEKEKPLETTKPSQLLLDLDDFGSSGSAAVLDPSNILLPSIPINSTNSAQNPLPKPSYNNVFGSTLGPRASTELLNRMSGGGISIDYCFSRTISIFSPKMISIELSFSNEGDSIVEGIRMESKKLGPGMQIQEFSEIGKLAPGNTSTAVMLVDFNDTTQPARFDVYWDSRKFGLDISPPVGEIILPNTMIEKDFFALQAKLGGMNENTCSVEVTNTDPQLLCNKVFKVANVLLVPCSQENVYLFAGQSASANADVLISMKVKDKKVLLKVNCENIAIGSMLIKDIKESLLSQT